MTRYFDRLREERGSVGVLMALVIFTVIGSLMMTWNTVQLSKEKMRLQNAADAAALGYCVWQARGMNAIQNINDEMYLSLQLAKTFQTSAILFGGMAAALEKAALVPILRWMKAIAIPFHVMALLTGGFSGWVSTVVCKFILKPAGYFYAYVSTPFGYLNAQQLAAENTADPLGNASLDLGHFGKLGMFALGLSIPIRDTLRLPVELVENPGDPWKHAENSALKALVRVQGVCPNPWRSIHDKFCHTGDGWDYQPWQSTKDRSKYVPNDIDPDSTHKLGRTPGPAIFIAHKYYTHIDRLPLDLWAKSVHYDNIRKMPVFAIAAAQCIAGDVVPSSKRKKSSAVNQRMAGFGVGATAKLISVEEALKWFSPTVSKAVSLIVYH